MIPLYLIFMLNPNISYGRYIAGAIFTLAAITDALDGYIARKYNLTTKVGAALDPLADKLMTFAVLISFTTAKLVPSWVLLILGIKEIVMISGGFILYLFKGNKVLPSNKYGKIATVSFYSAILSIIFKIPYHNITKLLIISTVVLNIVAFINYLVIYLSMDKDGRQV